MQMANKILILIDDATDISPEALDALSIMIDEHKDTFKVRIISCQELTALQIEQETGKHNE